MKIVLAEPALRPLLALPHLHLLHLAEGHQTHPKCTFSPQIFKEENILLKELLGRQISDLDTAILAVVLTRPSVSLYDTFVIDIGEDFGVKDGDRVLVSGDIFIGTVDEVHGNTSIVKLFSSPGVFTPVFIGHENISVNAAGVGGGNFIAKLPRGVDVEKGYVVTMSDINTRVFAVIEEQGDDVTIADISSEDKREILKTLSQSPVELQAVKSEIEVAVLLIEQILTTTEFQMCKNVMKIIPKDI